MEVLHGSAHDVTWRAGDSRGVLTILRAGYHNQRELWNKRSRRFREEQKKIWIDKDHGRKHRTVDKKRKMREKLEYWQRTLNKTTCRKGKEKAQLKVMKDRSEVCWTAGAKAVR